jgi:phosphoribosylformylglycinamidine (FGAM) synthase-like amidotransferase family enzyme
VSGALPTTLETPRECFIRTPSRGFKKDYYDRESGFLEPEDVDANFKFITDYLGGDQIVELIGGDSWGDHPNATALTARYMELVSNIKNAKDQSMESGTDVVLGTLNGAKVLCQYDGWSTPTHLSIMVNIKDVKKFDLGVDPFIKW